MNEDIAFVANRIPAALTEFHLTRMRLPRTMYTALRLLTFPAPPR